MSGRWSRSFGVVLGGSLLLLLLLPLFSLAVSVSPIEVWAAIGQPSFQPALWLSFRTTLTSTAVTIVMGTPLAWWLASTRSRWARVAEVVVDLPIVVPPAVVGVALLATFGRGGVFGSVLEELGIQIPFTTTAVVIAQVVVASPFYVQAAANAFRKVDFDTIVVARTLGASSSAAFLRVAVPIALPGLGVGAALAWARALGEFGATLLFAGNMRGRTQTMPLAIFSALESDVRLAVVFALLLAALGAGLLVGVRFLPSWTRRGQA